MTPNQTKTEIVNRFPEDLLEPCRLPKQITEGMTLNESLKILIENHGIYKECYSKHGGLVDAVRRRIE